MMVSGEEMAEKTRFLCYHFFWLSVKSPYFAHIAVEKISFVSTEPIAKVVARKMAEKELGLNGLLLEDHEGASYWDRPAGVYRVKLERGDPIETLGSTKEKS